MARFSYRVFLLCVWLVLPIVVSVMHVLDPAATWRDELAWAYSEWRMAWRA